MNERLRELYFYETDRAGLDVESDPDYQAYLSQSEVLWQGGDMPEPLFHLLERGNFLCFSHGFRLGLKLARWAGE